MKCSRVLVGAWVKPTGPNVNYAKVSHNIFYSAVLIERCHDAKCDDGGIGWGQRVRPGQRTQWAPTNLEAPGAAVLFNISFALAKVNLRKSRRLIGEEHIYFNM